MLDGLRGEHSIAELCRREGIAESLYYTWSKEFLEAGKRSAEIVRLQHGALHRIVRPRRKCHTFAARPIPSSRTFTERLRPPCLPGGIRGSTSAHSAFLGDFRVRSARGASPAQQCFS